MRNQETNSICVKTDKKLFNDEKFSENNLKEKINLKDNFLNKLYPQKEQFKKNDFLNYFPKNHFSLIKCKDDNNKDFNFNIKKNNKQCSNDVEYINDDIIRKNATEKNKIYFNDINNEKNIKKNDDSLINKIEILNSYTGQNFKLPINQTRKALLNDINKENLFNKNSIKEKLKESNYSKSINKKQLNKISTIITNNKNLNKENLIFLNNIKQNYRNLTLDEENEKCINLKKEELIKKKYKEKLKQFNENDSFASAESLKKELKRLNLKINTNLPENQLKLFKSKNEKNSKMNTRYCNKNDSEDEEEKFVNNICEAKELKNPLRLYSQINNPGVRLEEKNQSENLYLKNNVIKVDKRKDMMNLHQEDLNNKFLLEKEKKRKSLSNSVKKNSGKVNNFFMFFLDKDTNFVDDLKYRVLNNEGKKIKKENENLVEIINGNNPKIGIKHDPPLTEKSRREDEKLHKFNFPVIEMMNNHNYDNFEGFLSKNIKHNRNK